MPPRKAERKGKKSFYTKCLMENGLELFTEAMLFLQFLLCEEGEGFVLSLQLNGIALEKPHFRKH